MHRYVLATLAVALALAKAMAEEPPTMAGVLSAAVPSDWRELDQSRALYLFLDAGVVVFELAPQFAPRHIDNIRRLVADRYFDGLAIVRSQDNYVVQWGDPAAGSAAARSLQEAEGRLEPEFFRPRAGLEMSAIDSADAYADQVGFVDGFPVGSDGGRAWLAHCYGMLGAGRDNDPDSGSGAELYVVTGHSPRHLDRNVTLLGRAVSGIEHLSSLPRGTGDLGFYTDAGRQVPVRRMRFGDELDVDEQVRLDLLRTDTPIFDRLVNARRHRHEPWFVDSTGRIEICNVPLPVRPHVD